MDQCTLTIIVPEWAVVVGCAMALVTAGLSLYSTFLRVKIARLEHAN